MSVLTQHPVKLARLSYPFMVLRHPAPDTFDQATLEWVKRFGLVSGKQVAGFERIICGTAARFGFFSATPEVVGIAADLISWLFLFDDAYPEGTYRFDVAGLEKACGQYLHLLENYPNVAPHSNFARALLDLFERMGRHAPASWMKRFIESFRYYCGGCIREANFRQSNGTPTVAEYMDLRRASFGYAPMADLMELIFGTYFTDEERSSPTVVRLRTLGVDISACVNDLYSYEKESAVGDMCNVVRVVELNEGLSPEAACARVGQMHDEALGQLLLLESQLHALPTSAAVKNLARAIREWSQGHHDWSIRCRRYDPSLASDFDPKMLPRQQEAGATGMRAA
jgi:hypothetical protein